VFGFKRHADTQVRRAGKSTSAAQANRRPPRRQIDVRRAGKSTSATQANPLRHPLAINACIGPRFGEIQATKQAASGPMLNPPLQVFQTLVLCNSIEQCLAQIEGPLVPMTDATPETFAWTLRLDR